VRIKTLSSENESLGEIRIGDKAAFKYINFQEGVDSVMIRVSPGIRPCRITLSIDYQWSGSVGTVEIPAKQSEGWITIKTPIKLTKGIHALWFAFFDTSADMYGNSSATDEEKKIDLCTFDAFWFR
jgi:hypothetical protein